MAAMRKWIVMFALFMAVLGFGVFHTETEASAETVRYWGEKAMKLRTCKSIGVILLVTALLGTACLTGCGRKEETDADSSTNTIGQVGTDESEEAVDIETEEQQTQDEEKYPVGIHEGAFSAKRIEENNENSWEADRFYFKDATHISKRYKRNNAGIGVTYSYIYDETGKLVSCEGWMNDPSYLSRERSFEDDKIITTNYYKDGNYSDISEQYFDEYGMITKFQTPGAAIESEYTYEYEFDDNGDIKSVTRTNNTLSYSGMSFEIADAYKFLPYYIPQGKLEFDENGRKISDIWETSYGTRSSTWSYDENGWLTRETYDYYSLADGEMRTTVYTWEYTELTPGMSDYDKFIEE